MKVFISWSGRTSRAIALVLREYLPLMIQQIKPFMSQHDIAIGTRWAKKIQEELEQSCYGLIILTPSNVAASWILFEAGAISKLNNSSTACLLCAGLQPADVPIPLGQFQCQVFGKEEFYQLAKDMNFLTSEPLSDSAISCTFEKFWPEIENGYSAAMSSDWEAEKTTVPPRDDRAFQDEILMTVRNALRATNPGQFVAPDDNLLYLCRFSTENNDTNSMMVVRAFHVCNIEGYRIRDGLNRVFYECRATSAQWAELKRLLGDTIRID